MLTIFKHTGSMSEKENEKNIYAILAEFRSWNAEWEAFVNVKPSTSDDFSKHLSTKFIVIQRTDYTAEPAQQEVKPTDHSTTRKLPTMEQILKEHDYMSEAAAKKQLKERRERIATQLLAGILTNPKLDIDKPFKTLSESTIEAALHITDLLINKLDKP